MDSDREIEGKGPRDRPRNGSDERENIKQIHDSGGGFKRPTAASRVWIGGDGGPGWEASLTFRGSKGKGRDAAFEDPKDELGMRSLAA